MRGVPGIDRRLFAESRPARRQLVAVVLFGLTTAALVVAQAGLLTDVIVRATEGSGALAATLAGLLAVVLARAALSGAAEVTALRSADEVKAGLRGRVLAGAVRRGPAWLGGRRSGELVALLTSGLDGVDVYVARFLPQLALAVLVPPVVLARIALADWPSAVVLLVTAPLIPVFMALIGRYTRSRTARQWHLLAGLGGHFLDVVEGLPTLKVHGRARAQVGVIRQVTERYRRTTMATLRIAFTSSLALELLATLGTALVAVAVGLRLLGGGLEYRPALLALLLAPEVYLPLRALGAQFHASADGVAAATHAYAVLDAPEPADDGLRAARLGGLPVPDMGTAAVVFRDVTLRYPERELPALDRVAFTVPPGALLAVTGATGAGKSSVLALLQRFAMPTGGEVTVGGRRLDDLPVAAWRERIAWVPQTPYLFDGTVADNVRLGRPGASDAEVREALGLAEAAEFVAALPGGPAGPVGERGLRLSSGQRQRIALARAFLRDAPLLLLDEPTAHLDPLTAAGVRRAVDRLMAGRTVVLVTHDRRWVAAADVVVALADGRPAAAERVA
ncbi:thiol reductant ABC exporter subunit CydD [Petropleomorpha daqingensis]|uniref:Thiol reductant ABC exporter CydD subunit n=1 Tax=Petropleomorpha daqingensis TaxID=2026353 RepID=A0A853CL10_9ACTN|nr:thiol reductant ABC exporter CydD subunit [Petropleomorpha daqingensis]